jgi:hypothetical protein
VEALLDQWIAAAQTDSAKHTYERSSVASDQLLIKLRASRPDRYPTLKLLHPIGFALVRRDEARMGYHATLAAIAIELHRRKHGHYPETLNALDAAFGTPLPRDEYTGTPLIYRTEELGVWLYSVGPDRDDDGGRPCPVRSNLAKLGSEPANGDVIFLSPPVPSGDSR